MCDTLVMFIYVEFLKWQFLVKIITLLICSVWHMFWIETVHNPLINYFIMQLLSILNIILYCNLCVRILASEHSDKMSGANASSRM